MYGLEKFTPSCTILGMKTIKIACDVRDHAQLDELQPFQGELKSLSKEDYARLRREILETGFAFPIHTWLSPEGTLFIIGGHQRLRALKELRDAESYIIPPIPIIKVLADSFKQAKRRVLQDVAQYGKLENQGLYEFMSVAEISIKELDECFRLPDTDISKFGDEFFEDNIGPEEKENVNSSLAERFMIPPFSIFNAREGWWQDRKRQWIALGIKSELGRGQTTENNGGGYLGRT